MALTQVSTKGIKDATILNADINASAAIAKTKIETFVNNNGTTRFITGTNNVNELDAESNLTVNGSLITFSSSTLVVDKSTNPTISAKETGGNKEIALRANTTGGVLRTLGSYPLIFEIAQAEKMRIDSSGNFCIGTTSANAKLQIHNTGSPDSQLLRLVNTQHDTNAASSAQLKFGITNSLGERNCRIEAKEEGGNLNNVALDFYTNTASSTDGEALRMRIDSNGFVGIDNASPVSSFTSARNLVIGTASGNHGMTIMSGTGSSGHIEFSDGTSSDAEKTAGGIRYYHNGNYMRFNTNGGTERMRIDDAGRVGIKNTNMSSFNDGMDDLVIGNGVNGTSPGMTIFSNSSDIGSISFRDSADTGITGLIQYRHQESPPYMRVLVEGTERFRFTTFGTHTFGQCSAKALSASSSKAGNFDPYVFDVNGSAQSTETVAIKSQKNDCLDLTRYYTAGTIQTFRFNNDFTGHIETGTTSVTYHTSSDYRLKENAVAISDGITRLKQLKPYKFNFIKEPSVVHDGFFAHEVTPVVPTAVSGVKDATETRYYETGDILPEGKEIGDIKEENAVKPQSLDHSKLVPLLTAALKEEITKREALETRVAALEAA